MEVLTSLGSPRGPLQSDDKNPTLTSVTTCTWDANQSKITALLTGAVRHTDVGVISCPDLAKGTKAAGTVVLQGSSSIMFSVHPEEKQEMKNSPCEGNILGLILCKDVL